jgi:uncharacterized protein with PIN domain
LELAWPLAGGTVITSTERAAQLAELGTRWPIFAQAVPFTRCAECNAPLHLMDTAEARAQVPPYVAATQETFRSCPVCTRIFWNGTHTERILVLFREAAERCSQRIPGGGEERSAGSELSDPALPNG